MRITKVYTKVGDKGKTRIVGGAEVAKDAARIEAYGSVDELNSTLGVARTLLTDATRDGLTPMLATIQDDLFNVGTELATRPDDRWDGFYRIQTADIEQLEQWIDQMNDELPPLTEFILPGGGPLGAQLHVARTVCRRAERRCASLMAEQPDVAEGALPYLNRLSDHLFVAARWAAQTANEPETLWRNPNTRPQRRN